MQALADQLLITGDTTIMIAVLLKLLNGYRPDLPAQIVPLLSPDISASVIHRLSFEKMSPEACLGALKFCAATNSSDGWLWISKGIRHADPSVRKCAITLLQPVIDQHQEMIYTLTNQIHREQDNELIELILETLGYSRRPDVLKFLKVYCQAHPHSTNAWAALDRVSSQVVAAGHELDDDLPSIQRDPQQTLTWILYGIVAAALFGVMGYCVYSIFSLFPPPIKPTVIYSPYTQSTFSAYWHPELKCPKTQQQITLHRNNTAPQEKLP